MTYQNILPRTVLMSCNRHPSKIHAKKPAEHLEQNKKAHSFIRPVGVAHTTVVHVLAGDWWKFFMKLLLTTNKCLKKSLNYHGLKLRKSKKIQTQPSIDARKTKEESYFHFMEFLNQQKQRFITFLEQN